jgi:hypothetical protein
MNFIYKNCCLCGYELKRYYRNADPLRSGVCCEQCFKREVIPAREAKIREWDKEKRLDFAAEENKYVKSEESTCPSGKVQYKTKVDAEYALYQCNRETNHGNMNRNEKHVYFCKLCNTFHLTSHDQLPNWKNRNNAVNFNLKSGARYIPTARKENWETVDC